MLFRSDRGLSATGENKDYFARCRIAWLAGCLAKLGFHSSRVMDYGCGTGSATPYFLELLQPDRIVGVDTSEQSLEVARQSLGGEQAEFLTNGEYYEQGTIDLAFCNGVFHHIPPAERPEAVRYVHDALQPGGWFAFWENNPWNPGTRYVMSKIPFDRDAITLTGGEARRLLEENGFEVVCTDYLFIFPKVLKMFRWLEPYVSRLPLGAQYQVLARKMASHGAQALSRKR